MILLTRYVMPPVPFLSSSGGLARCLRLLTFELGAFRDGSQTFEFGREPGFWSGPGKPNARIA